MFWLYQGFADNSVCTDYLCNLNRVGNQQSTTFSIPMRTLCWFSTLYRVNENTNTNIWFVSPSICSLLVDCTPLWCLPFFTGSKFGACASPFEPSFVRVGHRLLQLCWWAMHFHGCMHIVPVNIFPSIFTIIQISCIMEQCLLVIYKLPRGILFVVCLIQLYIPPDFFFEHHMTILQNIIYTFVAYVIHMYAFLDSLYFSNFTVYYPWNLGVKIW